MQKVVYVTLEAIQKIGGIGAVVHGLLTRLGHLRNASQNILAGPFWTSDDRGGKPHRNGGSRHARSDPENRRHRRGAARAPDEPRLPREGHAQHSRRPLLAQRRARRKTPRQGRRSPLLKPRSSLPLTIGCPLPRDRADV